MGHGVACCCLGGCGVEKERDAHSNSSSSVSQPLSAALGGLRAGRCPPLHIHPPPLPFTGCLLCTRLVASSCNLCHFLQGSAVCPCFTKEMGKSVEMGAGLQQQMGPGGSGVGGGWSPGVAFGLWAADCLHEPAPSPPRAAAPPSTSWARSFPESRFGSSFLWVDGGGSRWGEFCFAPPGVHWPLILGVLVTRKDKPVVASVRGLSTGSLLLSRQLSRTQHWR